MLKRWGLADDLDDASYERIREHLRERTPEASRRAYGQAHIAATLTHYLAHPSCGGWENVTPFLGGDLAFDAGFHPLLGTLPLHEFVERADLECLEQVCDGTIATLDGLVAAVEDLIDRVVRLGAVGLKDHAAYTRGLSFGPPDRAAAAGELQRLLRGERYDAGARRLSDYLFHRIVQLSVDHRVPMVIHTGYLVGSADPKANVRHLIPVIEAYPEARFDLYHLNYPWFEDLFAVLKRFPNTWANCCWAHIIDPAEATQFLRRALGTIPANHVSGFGGDFVSLPEPVLAHLDIALDNIAAVLGEAIQAKWCSRATALDVARLWLFENPRELYAL